MLLLLTQFAVNYRPNGPENLVVAKNTCAHIIEWLTLFERKAE